MSDPLCLRCEHPLSEHCSGGKKHESPKEDMWAAQYRIRTLVCSTRHCDQPLCSCVEFIQEAA